MAEKSNVMPVSNIYVLMGDFREDRRFSARVRGRENLQKMIKKLAGKEWITGPVSLDDECKDYLKAFQLEVWDKVKYCALQEDKEDVVWGIVRRGKRDSVECRCYHTSCTQFKMCRPGYNPERDRPVIVRSAKWKAFLPEPALKEMEVPILPEPLFGSQLKAPDLEELIFEEEPFIPDDQGPVDIEEETFTLDIPVIQGQESIFKGEPDEHQLVLAGPGTGKTYCLIEKLKFLVEEKGSVEADTILILCFTRAAVREIRERFREAIASGRYSDDLSRLEIRTFDSFATRVLIARDADVTAKDYDERIQMVIDEIRNDHDILQEMRHFIVDEIQDLVGVRARLVQTILECSPVECGYTLLGDHLQGIYDYQIKDRPGELNATGLLKWLREEFTSTLKVIGLTENWRQPGKLANSSARARWLLESGTQKEFEKFFNDIVNKIKTCGVEHKFNIPLDGERKVAILCRNNGEVLKISNYLRRWGISHAVRRRKRNFPLLPLWIAVLLGGAYGNISLELLEKFNESEGFWPSEETNRIYLALESLTSARRNTLNLNEIREALAGGYRLPDEIYEGHRENIVISTIHQSKGREYDSVLFLRPDDWRREEDIFEEAKVFYVAITRAKNQLFAIERKKSGTYLTSSKSNSGRWTELAIRKAGRRTLVSVEIGMEKDIDEQSFVDGELLSVPAENQEYIKKEVRPGDPVEVRWVEGEREYYGIFHEKRLLGKMSPGFLRDIKNVMDGVYGKSVNRPTSFEEVYVDRIFSVVKKPETIRTSVDDPWAGNGVWYAVGIAGMGLVRWEFEC